MKFLEVKTEDGDLVALIRAQDVIRIVFFTLDSGAFAAVHTENKMYTIPDAISYYDIQESIIEL